MPIVTIKAKCQVTLPISVRRQAGLSVGDLLAARVEGKKITLTPERQLGRRDPTHPPQARHAPPEEPWLKPLRP